MSKYTRFFGIDIGKNQFHVCCLNEASDEGDVFIYSNDKQGHKDFLKMYQTDLSNGLVVLEATGGYETQLMVFLISHRIDVHRASPLQAKHFIRSLRLYGKTDELDAKALALYAKQRYQSLPLVKMLDENNIQLQSLISRRADLMAIRSAEQQRLKHPNYSSPELKKSILKILKVVQAEMDNIEKNVESMIKECSCLSQKHEIMTGIKGVGSKTAITLLTFMPELGTMDRKQAASLAGCAPHPKDSGKQQGYRRTSGGRSCIKKALFMAAMSARTHNTQMKTFYEKLIQKGKKPMVAITAIMRKIIVIINAKIRDYNQCKNFLTS